MKTLHVNICKAGSGFSAHISEVSGYVIARSSIAALRRAIPAGVRFHMDGLYPHERQPWMDEPYVFEYQYDSSIEPPAIARIFKEQMYHHNLKQKDLAAMLGLSAARLSELMSGKAAPSLKLLLMLRHKFKVDAAILLDAAAIEMNN